jgi:hypothetical protein
MPFKTVSFGSAVAGWLQASVCAGLRTLKGYCCALQYSQGKSLNAICGRGDLDTEKPRAYGCYDSKVANLDMAQRLQAQGIVGPAGREAGLEPFSWATVGVPQASHQGQPRVFDFEFELLSAERLLQAEQQPVLTAKCLRS